MEACAVETGTFGRRHPCACGYWLRFDLARWFHSAGAADARVNIRAVDIIYVCVDGGSLPLE